jgi:hypothetical protein
MAVIVRNDPMGQRTHACSDECRGNLYGLDEEVRLMHDAADGHWDEARPAAMALKEEK